MIIAVFARRLADTAKYATSLFKPFNERYISEQYQEKALSLK